MKLMNKCKKAAILATVMSGICLSTSVDAATVLIGGATDYKTATQIGAINGSWVTSNVDTKVVTDPTGGWYDSKKFFDEYYNKSSEYAYHYFYDYHPDYKNETRSYEECYSELVKRFGAFVSNPLDNAFSIGLLANDCDIYRVVLNGNTYAFVRQTTGSGTIKLDSVAIDPDLWSVFGTGQYSGKTDSVNAHGVSSKGKYVYLADYTNCQIAVGQLSSDGKSILNRSDLTINLKDDLAKNAGIDFSDGKYWIHGENVFVDGDYLYVLTNVNKGSAWSNYQPSYLIKYAIQEDGALKYFDHTTMGLNTDTVKLDKYNNHIFTTAIGGYQNYGNPNDSTSLDFASINEDGKFGINGAIKIPQNIKDAKTEFRNIRILPNGTAYVLCYAINTGGYETTMAVFKTTVSNLLADNPQDWEAVVANGESLGWFAGIDAEYYTKRVWVREGNKLSLYVDGVKKHSWDAEEFATSDMFTTMQAFDVMNPEGISGKLAELNKIADKVINASAVWNTNATVATVTGENTISGNAAITADASKVDLGNNISAAVYAKDSDVSINVGNLQLQSENTVATPVGIYAGNGKEVNIKADKLNVITKGYEDGNSLTNAIWLDPSAAGTQAKITIEAPVNISMTGGFGGNGIAIQKTDRWGESSTEAAQKAEVIIKRDVSIKGADNQTWGIGVNSENVFSRFNNAGILAAVNNSSVTVDGNVYMDVYGNGIATTAEGSTVTVKGGEITVPTGMDYGYYTLASYLGTINMNTGADGNTPGAETVKLNGDIFALKDTGNINLALTTAESYLNGTIDNGGNVKLYLQNGATWYNEANNTRYSLDSEDTGSLFGSYRASHVNTFVGASSLEKAGAIYQGLNSENIKIDNYSGNAVVLYERDANDKITGGSVTIGNAEAGSTIVARTNYTESLEADAGKVDQVLSDMAGKLFYTAATEGKTDLQGKVEIAEGLLTGAVEAEYYSDITFDGDELGQGKVGVVIEPEKPKKELTGNITGGITTADPVYGNIVVEKDGEKVIDFSKVQTKDEAGNDVDAGVIAVKPAINTGDKEVNIIAAKENPVIIEMGKKDLQVGAEDSVEDVAVQGIVADSNKVEIREAGKVTIKANGDASAIYATGANASIQIGTTTADKTVRLEANTTSGKAVLHAEDGATVQIGGKVNITKTSGNDAIMVGKDAQVVLNGGIIGSTDDDGVAIRILDGGKIKINQDSTQKVVTNGDIVFGKKADVPVVPDQPGGDEPDQPGGDEPDQPGGDEPVVPPVVDPDQPGESTKVEKVFTWGIRATELMDDSSGYEDLASDDADGNKVIDFAKLDSTEETVDKVVLSPDYASYWYPGVVQTYNGAKEPSIVMEMAGKDLEIKSNMYWDITYGIQAGCGGNITVNNAGDVTISAIAEEGGASAIYVDGADKKYYTGIASTEVVINTVSDDKVVTLKANGMVTDDEYYDRAVVHVINEGKVTINGVVDITDTNGKEAIRVGEASEVKINGGAIGGADDEVAIRLKDGGAIKINQVEGKSYDVVTNGDIVLEGASNVAGASKITYNTATSSHTGDIKGSGEVQNFAVEFANGAEWNGTVSGVELDLALNDGGIWNITGTSDASVKSLSGTNGFVNMGVGNLNIANYSGDTTFAYKNIAGVIEGGNVTITSATEPSNVTMRTNYDASYEDAANMNTALETLAGKLYYTNYATEGSLTAKAVIAEGLLTGAVVKKVNVDFDDDNNGQGYVVKETNSVMMSTFALRRTALASDEAGSDDETAVVERDITYSTKDSAHNADINNYTGEKQDFAVAFTNGADWNGNASGVNLDVLLEGADTVWTGSYDEGTIAGTGLTVEINDGATWKVQDKPVDQAKATNATNVANMKGTGGFVEMGADAMNITKYSGSTTFVYKNNDGNVTGGNVIIGEAAENSAVTMRTNYHESFEDETARNTAMDALAGKLFYNNANGNLSGIAVISEGLMTGEKAKYYSDITFDAANGGQGTAGEVVVVPDQSGSGADDDGGFQTTETTAVRISKSAMASSVMMWRNESDDVMQRMGDLRLGTEENGIWAKYYNGDASYNEAGTIYNSNYKAYQVGYDKKLANGWTVGAALSYNDAEHKYEMGTKGEGTAVGVTAYGAWNNAKGHFANIAVKGSQLDNEFDVTNATRDLTASGDYSTWGLSVSAEYGRRMEQSNGFYFEPSAKLTIGRVQDAEYTVTTDDGQQMFVEQGGFNSIVGEVGVGMGKRFERGTVFTKFALAHEFAGDFSSNFMDSNSRIVKSDADFGGSWYEWQLGGSVKVNDNSYVYATYEKTFGGDAARDWRVDAGVRWTF